MGWRTLAQVGNPIVLFAPIRPIGMFHSNRELQSVPLDIVKRAGSMDRHNCQARGWSKSLPHKRMPRTVSSGFRPLFVMTAS